MFALNGFALNGLKKHWRIATLICLALAQVYFIYATTRATRISEEIDNRLRFHAIPVALSHLWFDREYDYAGYRNICHAFQGERDLTKLFKILAGPDVVKGTEEYLWVVDDRGLADYSIAAFTLFGVNVQSLNKFHHLLMLAAVGAFILAYGRSISLLLVLNVYLLAVHVITKGLHNLIPIRDPSDSTWVFEGIGLHHSRLFDILGLLCLIHLLLPAWQNRKLTLSYVLTSLFQVSLLVFLYHCRSSLGWLFVAGAAFLGLRILYLVGKKAVGGDVQLMSRLATSVVPILLGACALFVLNSHKQTYYHPAYLGKEGARTIWHNALMGLCYHPGLSERYGFKISDHEIVQIVCEYARKNNYPEVDETWNSGHILLSCGCHTRFNWQAYERAARHLFFEVVRKEPMSVAHCFLVNKPKVIASLMYEWHKPNASHLSPGSNFPHGAGLNPARPTALILLAILILVGPNPSVRSDLKSVTRLIAILLPFSMAASVAFYPAIVNLGGFSILLVMGFYCLLMRAAFAAAGSLYRAQKMPDEPNDSATSTRPDLLELDRQPQKLAA